MNKIEAMCITAFALSAMTMNAQDGAAIFKQNCTACHKLGGRLVGPDLVGVTSKQSDEWLKKFIHSSQGMVKSGDKDAVAIWEEYNKTVMPDFSFTDAELTALIGFLGSTGGKEAATAKVEQAPVPPMVFTAADEEHGRFIFQHRMSGGGPACITCHNVNEAGVVPGGLLAKDLTHVVGRIGDQGVAGILGAPPFPAMAAAYNGSTALTDKEVHALTAFLAQADKSTAAGEASGQRAMLLWGLGGLMTILLAVSLVWNRRLRRSVKHDINARQLRTI